MEHVPSKDNLADTFTKTLSPGTYIRFRDSLVSSIGGHVVYGNLSHMRVVPLSRHSLARFSSAPLLASYKVYKGKIINKQLPIKFTKIIL